MIILLVLLLFAGFLGFYFYINRGSGRPTPPASPATPPNLFPFPDGATPPGSRPPPSGGPGTEGGRGELPKLRQISSEPVAGAAAISEKELTRIRYVERRTSARIFETTSVSSKKTAIASTNIPKVIYGGYWTGAGEGVVLQYLKDDEEIIESFYARLVAPEKTDPSDQTRETSAPREAMELEGVFLPSRLSALAVSPKKDRIFYLLATEGGSVGTISRPDGTKKVEVWNSPAKHWLAAWPKEDILALTTKPGSFSEGFLFFLNTRAGSVTKILGGVEGLLTLPSADAKLVLYSGAVGGSLYAKLLNADSLKEFEFPVSTLADKCLWSQKKVTVVYCAVPTSAPTALYPDDWYQGKVSFDDELVKIDTTTGETTTILKPEAATKETMDITNMSLDGQEKILLFQNKKDLSLWALTLP